MIMPTKEWTIPKTQEQNEQQFEQAKQQQINEAIKWIKSQFTRHQSTSVCVIDNNTGQYVFKSPPFGHNKLNRTKLLVGVMLKANLCHIQRVFKYDGGSVDRSYDQPSAQKMREYLYNEKRGVHFYSTQNMVDSFDGVVKPSEHTEIMAALRFAINTDDGATNHNINNFAITVFSNNLESRLLAQLRHRSLIALAKTKDEYKNLKSPQVPIVIYGEDCLGDYGGAKQEVDIQSSEARSQYQHYIDAIKYIETGSASDLSQNFLSDDFIKLVAAVSGDGIERLLDEQLDTVSAAITSIDTFFMIMKNVESEKQEQLLEQIKGRLLGLANNSTNRSVLYLASENGYPRVVEGFNSRRG